MENKSQKGIKKFLFDWILPIGIAVVIALLIREFLFFQIEVPTSSMYPTIHDQEKFMTKRVYNPEKLERGDIIVFESKEMNDTLVKRLIGLPNDHIVIKDGIVSINGEVLDEDGTFDVPEGKYFFLGDNRADSADARYWKNHYIDGSDIKSKVLFRTFPLDKFGKVE